MFRTATAMLKNSISVLVGPNLVIFLVALVASNYIYQYLTHADWDRAFERSFFQAIAIVGFAILKLREKR
jgi:hypothetical protein